MNEIRTRQFFKKPVFVVGMPRSGTTLIQGILCNTDYYFPVPETHYFSRVVYGLPEELNKSKKKKICRILHKKARINIDYEYIKNLKTQKEIFEFVIGKFNKDKKDTFLEKTPRHVFFYSKIIKYYPSAKFICMIREPKNVVSSQISSTRIDQKSIIRLSYLYNKISTSILDIKNNNNVLIVKYEELTKEPELILKKIFKFLDIPYNSIYIEKVAAPPEIVSEHEFWKNKNIDQDKIHISTAGKWRKTLSNNEANMINYITKSHAEKYGYSLSFDRMGVLIGIMQDIRKIFSPRELKRLLSKIHG